MIKKKRAFLAYKQIFMSFYSRGGIGVFVASIFSKMTTMLVSILLSRILSTEDYGVLAIGLAVLFISQPVFGFGLQETLLRFGAAIHMTLKEKTSLYMSYLKFGTLFALIVAASIFAAMPLLIQQKSASAISTYQILAFAGVTLFFFQLTANYFRILGENNTYSKIIGTQALLTITLAPLAGAFLGITGIALSWVLVPAITSLAYIVAKNNRQSMSLIGKTSPPNREMLTYGLWVGLGGIASQGALMLDTIMVGIYNGDVAAGLYRNASLLPLSLMFLPGIYMTSEFVHVRANADSSEFISKFYKDYLMVFAPLAITILAVLITLPEAIITTLFGAKYVEAAPVLSLLGLTIIPTFLIRIPVGNILNAVGRANNNVVSAFIVLILNATLNYLLIPEFGLFGAAYASLGSIIVGSVISLYYLREHVCQQQNK